MAVALLWLSVLALLVLESSAFSWSALSLEVAPGAEECFYQVLSQGDHFELEYEVVRGGLLDIEVVILDSRRNAMYRKTSFFSDKDENEIEEEGYISLTIEHAGEHSICFDNSMSKWTKKTISFALPNRSSEDKDIAKLEHLGPMVDSIMSIIDKLDDIEKLQHYMRVREWVHRDSKLQTFVYD